MTSSNLKNTLLNTLKREVQLYGKFKSINYRGVDLAVARAND